MKGIAGKTKVKILLLLVVGLTGSAVRVYAQTTAEDTLRLRIRTMDTARYRYRNKVQGGDSLVNRYQYQNRRMQNADTTMMQNKNRNRYRYEYKKGVENGDTTAVRNKNRNRIRKETVADSAVMKRERKRLRDENCDGVPDSAQVRTKKRMRNHTSGTAEKDTRKRMNGENSPGTSATDGTGGMGSHRRHKSRGGHN